jgi:hypothetical protein
VIEAELLIMQKEEEERKKLQMADEAEVATRARLSPE